jgi:GAF domain-containing protein
MQQNDLLHKFLAEGTKKFGLDLGIVSNINDDIYLVYSCKENHMGITPGSIFELSQTYCADVINDGCTKYYEDVAEITEMQKHPCYLSTQLRAYVGTPVTVNGNIWGTLNYSSQLPRKLVYSAQDIEFLESQAQEVGRILEKISDKI